MSVKAILETMALLIKQHQELNVLSREKTEWIKKNDTKQLVDVLKKENKHIRMMEQTETQRQQAVRTFLYNHGETEKEATVSLLLTYVSKEYHDLLLQLQERLLAEMQKLRQQETLNRALVEESLQFVHMTMDMIQPDPDAVHYRPPGDDDNRQSGYSTFDSKA
ncbi:FlgN protein [Alteribacillus persepolensis]|uniref:FlgN protein n=1 Tax=Alteribacillus persepolensis TaxID=568899 RepID=A0A1G8AEM2_9BACI|nr:flagellar protein FlgN [Alteribacillus persepolensis]SDH19465.1 FlgN protein [Alteribacillus persepolensis]